MPTSSDLIDRAARTRLNARRARRFARELFDESDRQRVVAFAAELDARALLLEQQAQMDRSLARARRRRVAL